MTTARSYYGHAAELQDDIESVEDFLEDLHLALSGAEAALDLPGTFETLLRRQADVVTLPKVIVTALSALPYGIGTAIKQLDRVAHSVSGTIDKQADVLGALDKSWEPAKSVVSVVEAVNSKLLLAAKAGAHINGQVTDEARLLDDSLGRQELPAQAYMTARMEAYNRSAEHWFATKDALIGATRTAQKGIDAAAGAIQAAMAPLDGLDEALDSALAVFRKAQGIADKILDSLDVTLDLPYPIPDVNLLTAIKGVTGAFAFVSGIIEDAVLGILKAIGIDINSVFDSVAEKMLTALGPAFGAIQAIIDAGAELLHQMQDAGQKIADTLGHLGDALLDMLPSATIFDDPILGDTDPEHVDDHLAGTGDSDAIFGLTGRDVIHAAAGDDFVFGGSDNDRLYGEAGRDEVYGGDGDDFAYGGAGNDILSGGFGNDVLIDEVKDGGAYDDASALVFRLYKAALDRAPQRAAEMTFTDMLLEGKLTPQQLANVFARSAEFRHQHSGESNAEYITHLFHSVLGHDPAPAGLKGWTKLLDDGTMTRSQVLLQFAQSPEFQHQTAHEALDYGLEGTKDALSFDLFRLFQGLLDRVPNQAGFDQWLEQMAHGVSFDTVANKFVHSPEFSTRFAADTDSAFVTLLFQNILGRDPAGAGLKSWTDALHNGSLTRGEVAELFIASREFVHKTLGDFQGWLGKLGLNDVLDGGAGDDVEYGGPGADTFHFRAAEAGTDMVVGLQQWDIVELEGSSFKSRAEVMHHLTQEGSDVVLDMGAAEIHFAHRTLAEINPEMFHLL